MAVTALAIVAPSAVRAEVRNWRIGADEMTRQAATRFPLRRCALMLACVTLSDPRIRLMADDDRLHLTVGVLPEVGGQPMAAGEMDLAGRPRYDRARGAFYLDGAAVTDSRFPGLGRQQARTVSDLASSLLAEALRTEPIYSLDDGDSREALARLVLREVRVRDGRLELVTGDAADDD